MSIAGVDPRDAEWLAAELEQPTAQHDGPCVATFAGELLGAFPNAAAAEAAQNALCRELDAQGVDLLAMNPTMTVVFTEIH